MAPAPRNSDLFRKLGWPQLSAVLAYLSEQAGYRPGLRRQLRQPPFNTPGLPSHSAMALIRTHAAVAVATSPTVPEARAPIAVSHQAVSTARLSAVDFFRGLAITEVVLHHSTTLAMRHLPHDSPAFMGTAMVNQTLHFAVPAFIFLSSTVLTRSLLKDFQPVRYYWRRLLRGAWPYLLWSLIYVLWSVLSGRREAGVLTNPAKWQVFLLWGKANYHLYFMLVALELYAVLPLLLPLARRRPPIWGALLGGFALQMALYYLNREVLRLPYPASTIMWYGMAVILGVTVGSRLSEFSDWFQKNRRWLLGALVMVFPPYLLVSVQYVLGKEVLPVAHNGLSWLYTSLVALSLLGLAYQYQKSEHWFRIVVSLLGTVSLQVYLLHPMMLATLEGWFAPSPSDPPALTLLLTLIYAAVVLVIPAVVGRLLAGGKLSLFLFGR